MYAVCGGVAAVHVCVGTGVRMCGWMYIGLQCTLLLPTGLGLSSDSFFVHVLVLYMYMSFFTDLMDDFKNITTLSPHLYYQLIGTHASCNTHGTLHLTSHTHGTLPHI